MSRLLSFLLVLVLHLPATAADEPAPQFGAESPAALANAVATALNAGNADGLAPLLARDPPAWITAALGQRGSNRSMGRRWEGSAGVLPADRDEGEPVVVLSTYHPVESDDDHVHRIVRRRGNWRLGPEIPAEHAAREFRIRDHRLRVVLDPERHAMTVTDLLAAERLPGAGRLMLTGLGNDYRVRSVVGSGRALNFLRVGGLLAIQLPEDRDGGPFTLEIEYEGRVEHLGWEQIDPKGTFVFSYWYPHIARLPATAEVTIEAPADLTVIGQGERKRTERRGDRSLSVWRQDHPVCWVMFAAGRWHVTERKVGDKTYGVYLLRPDAARAEAALRRVETSIAFFSERFSPFPWSHYEVVELPLRGGALESYTFTVCGPRTIPGVIRHEVSHSWWGGIVPNPYTHDMWSEAFATFSDQLAREVESPSSSGRGRRPRLAGRGGFADIAISEARNALDGAESSVGYEKGAAVLHLLRHRLGDETFFRTLQQFIRRCQGRAASWRDYAATVERVVGPEIRPFFDQWLDRRGLPRVGWSTVSTAEEPGGKHRLTLGLRQSEPTYTLDLPLTIETMDGAEVSRILNLHAATLTEVIELPGPPRRLRLDPEGHFPLAPDRASSPSTRDDPWTYEIPVQ